MLSVILSIQVVDVSLWSCWVSLNFLGLEVVGIDFFLGDWDVSRVIGLFENSRGKLVLFGLVWIHFSFIHHFC